MVNTIETYSLQVQRGTIKVGMGYEWGTIERKEMSVRIIVAMIES